MAGQAELGALVPELKLCLVSQLGHKIPCRLGGRKKIGGDIRVAAAVARRSNETREKKERSRKNQPLSHS
jgi:hypothetical protein